MMYGLVKNITKVVFEYNGRLTGYDLRTINHSNK